MQLRHHQQILQTTQVCVEIRLLRNVTEMPTIGPQILRDQSPCEEDLARAWANETSKHLHRGRFAGTIRTKVSRDLTGPCKEGNVLDGWNPRVALAELS